ADELDQPVTADDRRDARPVVGGPDVARGVDLDGGDVLQPAVAEAVQRRRDRVAGPRAGRAGGGPAAAELRDLLAEEARHPDVVVAVDRDAPRALDARRAELAL